jgi:hypothetical protein
MEPQLGALSLHHIQQVSCTGASDFRTSEIMPPGVNKEFRGSGFDAFKQPIPANLYGASRLSKSIIKTLHMWGTAGSLRDPKPASALALRDLQAAAILAASQPWTQLVRLKCTANVPSTEKGTIECSDEEGDEQRARASVVAHAERLIAAVQAAVPVLRSSAVIQVCSWGPPLALEMVMPKVCVA